MTVGIGAICDAGTHESKVVLSSDRLVTTLQQSRIEHERPETKLIKFGTNLSNTHLVGVVAGSVQLGETLQDQIRREIQAFVSENDEEPWVSTAADLAGAAYQKVVQNRIENRVLRSYGLSLEDLSRQHQFQDSFLNDILAEVDALRNEIHQNLTLLLGGVGFQGPGIFLVATNDVLPQNGMGYAAIGSGTQPAESEFIKTQYVKSEDLNTAFATIAAAHHQAKKASGVGGEPDIIVVDSNGVHEVDKSTRDDLMDRQEKIATKQQNKKDKILSNDTINWSP
jgi:20S proteasome alpha/beta subunit